MTSTTDLSIGSEIYEELYSKIEDYDGADDDDEYSEFLFFNGNHENSLHLLSEGYKYYIDGVVNEWDDILNTLSGYGLLEGFEPKDMTKRKLTDLFLYQVCSEVIRDYLEVLHIEQNEEQDRVDKFNDFKDEVDANNYHFGSIDGETLKDMGLGEYFNKHKIDNEECYVIKFYEPKEKKEHKDGFSEVYFEIEELSNKIHYCHFNTSSAFALEMSNISYVDEE